LPAVEVVRQDNTVPPRKNRKAAACFLMAGCISIIGLLYSTGASLFYEVTKEFFCKIEVETGEVLYRMPG
jgi:hypothetical protein